MHILKAILALILTSSAVSFAGDDSSGNIKYAVNLGEPFVTYKITNENIEWGKRLAERYRYSGKIVYFVRTSIALEIDDKKVDGEVYQRQDLNSCFYVAKGDYMLKIGSSWPASPGIGGFTLIAPKSRDFLVCMNCNCAGVPALSSTPVEKDKVTWKGHEYTRF